MQQTIAILGSAAAKYLQETEIGAVLTVGKDHLTRADLARVGCYNYVAARRMSNALADFRLPNLRELFDSVPPSALAVPNVGAIGLAVLGAAFEAKGIGDLDRYVDTHRAEGERAHTFLTTKKRVLKEHLADRRGRRVRRMRKAS